MTSLIADKTERYTRRAREPQRRREETQVKSPPSRPLWALKLLLLLEVTLVVCFPPAPSLLLLARKKFVSHARNSDCHRARGYSGRER